MAGALVRWCVARCGGGGWASRGGAFQCCEGRPVLGAVPPPAARPPERAARVPRPACPGRGRCGQWTLHRPHSVCPCGPALLAVGVAEGRPRGGACHRCEGRLVSGAVPPRPRSPSVACSQGSATRVSRARSMRACGPSTGPTACALAGRRCSLWGWRNGVPGGGAFHRCESGAVPPPAARPPERAARVPRPACSGCGRCGHVDQHRPHSVRPCGPALLAVGVAEGRPRGGAFHRCEGRLVSGAVPPRPRSPSVACSQGSATRVSRARLMWACDPVPAPRRAPLRAGVVRCGGGGRASPGGLPSTVVRGVWCQALSLPPLVSGACSQVPRPACPGRGRCGRVDPGPAPQRAPLRADAARCGGGGRASPGGVPSTVVRGAWCQALSLPRPLVLRSVQPGFRDPRVPGAVDAGVWTQHRPTSCALAGRCCSLWGWRKGVPGGGAFHRCEGRLVSGAVPPPAALVLRSVQPGFRDPRVPGAVDAGVWTQHRPHSVRPCGPALLAVGVAEGRPRGGCLPPL